MKFLAEMDSFFEVIEHTAFQKLKSRVETLQNYIEYCLKNSIDPTVEGAFFAAYPHLKIFMKVLGKLKPHPGDSLMLDDQSNYRTLKNIMDTASMAGKLSLEEQAECRDLIEKLKKTAPDSIVMNCCY
jgi:hypothetical protein